MNQGGGAGSVRKERSSLYIGQRVKVFDGFLGIFWQVKIDWAQAVYLAYVRANKKIVVL